MKTIMNIIYPAFALFALTPVILALRCATTPARISAAVAAGLLAISAVWPLPELLRRCGRERLGAKRGRIAGVDEVGGLFEADV